MPSSAQLEQQAERTRSDLARTLEELRGRMTPGQLVDQAVDFGKGSGGGQFVRNLGRQMVANPLPVTLIGAGMAWLMLSSGSRSAGRATDEWTTGAGEGARAASDGVSHKAANAAASAAGDAKAGSKAAASGASAAVSEGAASRYGSAKARASDASERASDAGSDGVSDIGRKCAASTSDFLTFCRNQPMVLAGLGVAFGAIMGTLVPSTETEDRLMGDASADRKERPRKVAGEQSEKSKPVAQGSIEPTKAGTRPSEAREADQDAEASLVPDDGGIVAEEFLD